jgi:hypothetical protein
MPIFWPTSAVVRPFAVRFHQDDALAAVTGRGVWIGLAEHIVKPGHAAIGDEGFAAVDHPFVTVFDSGGVHEGDVRTMVRLGKCAGGEHLAFGHGGQVFLFLLISPVMHDDFRGERGQGDGAADGGIAAAQFFDDQNVLNGAEPLSGVFLREVNPQQPQIAGLFPDFAGKFVLLFQFEGQFLVKFTFYESP